MIDREGNPWFVAQDIRRALAIQQGGKWMNCLQADEKIILNRGDSIPSLFKTRAHEVAIISGSGLYKLVMRSDKPRRMLASEDAHEARAFQDWVTRDVLTAIRKDGANVMGEEKVRTGEIFP